VPETPVDYAPGQYSRFTFPFHIDDPHGVQHRTFSFISHPSESDLRVITRIEQPLSPFKEPLSKLAPGEYMEIDEPHGDAILPRIDTTPLVFVAQGIALASFTSMLTEIAKRRLAHPVTLLWAHKPTDTSLDSLVPKGVGLKTKQTYTYPERLTASQVGPHITNETLVYLSGSQQFVETLGAALEQRGTPRERIIYDYYDGYADL